MKKDREIRVDSDPLRPKRLYSSPKLIVFGTVKDLTTGGTGTAAENPGQGGGQGLWRP